MKTMPQTPSTICTFLILWLGMISPPTAPADIYSWTDANGVRHFSNKPPQGRVVDARQSEEIPYDEAGDRRNQEADDRYFDQRAVQNTLRRLEQTERALKESLDRAREAESRANEWSSPYEDDHNYDDGEPDYWITYSGGNYGGYYDGDDRGRGGERDRRSRHRQRRGKDDRGKGWRDGRPGGDSEDTHIRRHKRTGRQRLSKRERGVRSGLTRAVRAVPSPYYMGYRPVYSGGSGSAYESRRGGQGRRAYLRGGGGMRGGGRARVGF